MFLTWVAQSRVLRRVLSVGPIRSSKLSLSEVTGWPSEVSSLVQADSGARVAAIILRRGSCGPLVASSTVLLVF